MKDLKGLMKYSKGELVETIRVLKLDAKRIEEDLNKHISELKDDKNKADEEASSLKYKLKTASKDAEEAERKLNSIVIAISMIMETKYPGRLCMTSSGMYYDGSGELTVSSEDELSQQQQEEINTYKTILRMIKENNLFL